MKSKKWQEVSALFQIALDCEPDQRITLLNEKCGDDDELRREVEELLRLHNDDENDDFLVDSPVEISAKLLTNDLSPSLEGRQIGVYKILHEIGKGGMGVVCLAQRDDEFRKRVALKLLKRGMDSDEILARFRHERQILASLDHPNIARLLDGGTTNDGLPFFVMEYVEGEAIDKYCESQRLSLDERLKLFQKVCAAVSYAHQNLVVHRDLKPSNILVGSDGEPKLLDFGIAKLLKPDLFPSVVAPTGLIMRPMTPDYASPEQVRGLPITTASDVYSLGVLLYELLTGQRPYHFKSNNAAEIERVVCETEPIAPSRAIAESGMRNAESKTEDQKPKTKDRKTNPQLLRGDLDNILLKALRKESNRRYSSVEQFAEDIRRHLAGLPILAHENNFRYRASKFIRRNRISLGIAALFVILISSFAVAFYFQARRAERERERAELQSARAEKVTNFLVDIFKVSNPFENQGKTMTARELLDKGATRVESEMQNQPEIQAALMLTMGSIYENLGFFDDALILLQKSLTTRRQFFGNESEEVGETLEQLALTQFRKGDYPAAGDSYREALTIWRKIYGDNHDKTAFVLDKLGQISKDTQNYGESEKYYREALQIARITHGNEHQSVVKRLNLLGDMFEAKGDLASAEKFFREALALIKIIQTYDPASNSLILNNLIEVLTEKGELAEAESLANENLQSLRRIYGDNHQMTAYSLLIFGKLLETKKDYAGAEDALRKSVKIYEKIFGKEHPQTALAERTLGHFLTYQRKFDEAEKLLREAAALQIKAQGESHPIQALPTRFFLATLLAEKGDHAGAEKLLLKIMPEVKQRYVAPHDMLGLTFLEYGKVLLTRGDASRAEPFLREGWENLKKTGSAFKWTSAEAESALGECLLKLGRREEAKPLLEESYNQLKERLGAQREWMVERARQRLAKLR